MASIYEIRNKKTNKGYIGSTMRKPKKRWNEHLHELRNNSHSSTYLQNSFDKHGEESFKFIVLEEVKDEKRFEIEQHWLDDVLPFPWSKDGNGYNMSSIAGGGDNFSDLTEDEQEEFIRKSKKVGSENGMHNQEHKEDAIKKMREEAEDRFTLNWFQNEYGQEKGKEKYEERCLKLSKERSGEKNPFYGENHDKETKKQISESMKEVANDENWRDKVSEARKGKATGKDNPNYVHVPKNELKEKIQEGLVSSELADYFDTSQNTITRKVNEYWDEGLRQVRKQVS